MRPSKQGASQVVLVVKKPPDIAADVKRSLGQEDDLERGWRNPLQYSCLENPHGQRNLVHNSPWDKTEAT